MGSGSLSQDLGGHCKAKRKTGINLPCPRLNPNLHKVKGLAGSLVDTTTKGNIFPEENNRIQSLYDDRTRHALFNLKLLGIQGSKGK